MVDTVALRADQLGVPREKLRYTPARVSSPYMEAAFENLNQSLLEDPVVEANPLYRFSSIFSRLFDINTEGLEQTRQVFFDVVMQYLVQLDLRQGLCREEYYLRFLLKDFQDGVCLKIVPFRRVPLSHPHPRSQNDAPRTDGW